MASAVVIVLLIFLPLFINVLNSFINPFAFSTSFFLSIFFSIAVLLLPKVIPLVKERFHIPTDKLVCLLDRLFVILLIVVLFFICIVDMPVSAICAICIPAIISFIPAVKLRTAIKMNDSGAMKDPISQIRSLFTFILIVFLTYMCVLSLIDTEKLLHLIGLN